MTEIRLALELDPLSPSSNFLLGVLYNYMRQHDRAIEQQRLAIELAPDYATAYASLALAYSFKGLHDEAISTADRAVSLSGRSSLFMYILGCVYARAGRIAEAHQLLEELKERSRATYVPPFAMGIIQLALGELDDGFDQLTRAIEERDLMAIWDLKPDLYFDPFRSHPRFQAILRKMNLQP